MSGRWRGEWDHAELGPQVRLGADVWLENRASFARVLARDADALVLGDRVRVYAWSGFSIEPAGRVEIGADAVVVGAKVMCAESITIGPRSVLSYGVVVTDSDFHPVDVEERRADCEAIAPQGDRSRRRPFPSRPVVIGADVRVGAGAVLLKGVVIGDGAVVAAGAVVTGAVPAGSGAVGNPARVVGLAELP